MASEPTVADNPAASRFEITIDGQVAGFSEYRRSDGEIEFTHTVVDDAYEGQGLGSILVKAALDNVRGDGVQVVATCPFVNKYIKRHREYADLLAPGH
jgi:predicted GNAT family acetyltransferase